MSDVVGAPTKPARPLDVDDVAQYFRATSSNCELPWNLQTDAQRDMWRRKAQDFIKWASAKGYAL